MEVVYVVYERYRMEMAANARNPPPVIGRIKKKGLGREFVGTC